MIKVILADVVNATETFNKIMGQTFKGSLAFKIARLARELNKEMETFNEERRKLIMKYGKKDENGEYITDENGNIRFDSDDLMKVNEEFTALLQNEIEINAEKIPIGDIDNFEITPQEMLNVEKFFDFE